LKKEEYAGSILKAYDSRLGMLTKIVARTWTIKRLTL
jgi:hypothetical protein